MTGAGMKCNEEGLQLIRDSEGLRLKAYQDSGGVWTIGYGHTGGDVRPGSEIDEAAAEILLAQDVARAERAVRRLVWAPLNENQFSAVVSLAFNVGERALRGSRTIGFLNQRRFFDFADALLLWDKYTAADGTKQPLKGLTKRRRRERELFLKPVVVK